MKQIFRINRVVKNSEYILRVIVFDALNRQGDYISHFSFKDYNLNSVSEEFSDPEGAKGEFYWVNENTCPTNIIDTSVELLDGPHRDPHGVLTLIGYIPEKILSSYVEQINKESDGKFSFANDNGVSWGVDTPFFNFLLRLYKSLYHLVRSSYIHVSVMESPMEFSKGKQPYYFIPFTPEYHSRINYLVCELLLNAKGLLGLVNTPKGRIIDVNQSEDMDDGDYYNGLIYGLPQYLFSERSGIGHDRLLEILNVKSGEYMCDEESIIKSYHEACYIQKVDIEC